MCETPHRGKSSLKLVLSAAMLPKIERLESQNPCRPSITHQRFQGRRKADYLWGGRIDCHRLKRLALLMLKTGQLVKYYRV